MPRISKLMALAIHCDALIRNGDVADQSELARLLHVTQPRMTQIMNLLLLAPDIQEALLFLLANCGRLFSDFGLILTLLRSASGLRSRGRLGKVLMPSSHGEKHSFESLVVVIKPST